MWWLIPVFIVVAFLAVLIIRALLFTPKKQIEASNEEISFDKEKAANCLKELVTCKTISYFDSSLEDDAEFKKLVDKLPKLYPTLFKYATLTKFNDRGLLFHVKGKNDGDPAVFMSHYDVVPVLEEGWEKPPFEGIIEDGVLWGRGTLDTKVTMNGALFAADHLLANGFVPENDMYFAFSGNEEVNGKGAVNIVEYFYEKGITPSLVLDEGGAVVENVFPGVKGACALIGIAEKGMLNAEYLVESSGGHASAPKPNAPIDRLSKACCKVLNNPFKSHITPPVAKMFDTLGRHSTFLYRMIFSNLWLFKPVLDILCKLQGGELNALMRTTVAFTQMEGSNAPNVIPPQAKMVSNMRLNPNDTVDSAVEYLRKTVDDDKVKIIAAKGINPSRISITECDGYEKIASAVASTWKGSLVSPYLMVQCSDSRHYGKISDRVYRFSAMDLTTEERASIHGHNERIRLDALNRSVEFYIRLLKQC